MHEGEDLYVGDAVLVVCDIVSKPAGCIVVREDGERFEITEDLATEVLPDVFLSVGSRSSPAYVRLVIDAPRSLEIIRGDRARGE